MRKPTVIASLFLSLLGPLVRVQAGPLRICLLADTTIQSDTIVLARLLPPDTPRSIHEKAEGIALGRAPLPGSARTFSRNYIESLLTGAGFPAVQFAVPETVVVRREVAALTPEKVWLALRAAAARHGWALPQDLRPEEIEWAAPVAAPEAEAPLEVQEAYLDPLLHQMRFRLHVAGNPNAPSFSAWCPARTQPRAQSGAKWSAGEPFAAGQHASAAAELVSPRRLATLHLHSENSFAMLQVRPLDAGALGQSIRVRLPSNGHTLRARVIDRDVLDAAF